VPWLYKYNNYLTKIVCIWVIWGDHTGSPLHWYFHFRERPQGSLPYYKKNIVPLAFFVVISDFVLCQFYPQQTYIATNAVTLHYYYNKLYNYSNIKKIFMDNTTDNATTPTENTLHEAVSVAGMYQNWFLEYASYVILERAVPTINDGLKPVQRRILHAMKELDDGRFNKVANIIGTTMQYHPHGDASIGDAIVNVGQKDLMIETQGNWGDIRTGDGAAAPRYIEARLSKFALEVAFNKDTTEWQLSYDGRKNEPVNLPMKFPLLLAQGAEGIAVGLSTKILPHNFCELIEASIDILRKRKVEIFPDFLTGGAIDVSNYNGGKRGGKVRVRAKIQEIDNKTLAITQIPFGTTTDNLIESIVKANDAGKIKIKKVIDNTAQNVEIVIQLAPGVSPDVTIDALFAFTDCENSISPNACVIINNKPVFLTVNEILEQSTHQTQALLRWELENLRHDLQEKYLFASLEKIFIENKIYRSIEDCETWESVITTIDAGLEPYKPQFYRAITTDDIVRLTEIKIKRISKFDAFKADDYMRTLAESLQECLKNLANITDYTISFFKNLLKKYGKNRERKTEIKPFDTIQIAQVAIANEKLYVNRIEGFVGYGIKKDEYVSDCSDLDDVIVFLRDGTFKVVKVSEKAYIGKGIIHVAVWKKNDDRTTYNALYTDGENGNSYAKRFGVTAITRDKEYDLTQGTKNSKLHYFTANNNAESEIVTITLSQNSPARKKIFDFDFAELAIKGRGSMGNVVSKYTVKKVTFKEKGRSSIGGKNLWYDEKIGRLNADERGSYLGGFDGEDKILVLWKDGSYELTNYELTNRYEPELICDIAKFDAKQVVTAAYFAPKYGNYYIKRFKIETTTPDKRFVFTAEEKGAKLAFASLKNSITATLHTGTGKATAKTQVLDLVDFVDIKGWKSLGNKLCDGKEFKALDIITNEYIATDPTEIIEETTQPSPIETAAEVVVKTTVAIPATPEPQPAAPQKRYVSTGETIEFDIDKPTSEKPAEQVSLGF
jgi:topoisomerase-4 subunit A